MTEPSSAPAEGLAYLCAHLEQIRAVLGTDDALERLVGVARQAYQERQAPDRHQAELAELLGKMDDALRGLGDPRGVYEHGVRGPAAVGVERLESVFRCPLGLCVGRADAEVEEPSPICSISGRALTRELLD